MFLALWVPTGIYQANKKKGRVVLDFQNPHEADRCWCDNSEHLILKTEYTLFSFNSSISITRPSSFLQWEPQTFAGGLHNVCTPFNVSLQLLK